MRMLKPSLLVSLKTRVVGGRHYGRKDLENSPEFSRWETTKQVDDPEELKRAESCRSAARQTIASVCVQSDFGLLCPKNRKEDLINATAVAQMMVSEFNEGASTCHVEVYSLTGEIASSKEDELEATRAINSEIADIVNKMRNGIAELDVKAVRAAASEALRKMAVLEDGQSMLVKNAVDDARAAAREIVRRIQKDGESAAVVLSELKLKSMENARMAFMDFGPDIETEMLPVANMQRFAALEIDSGEPVAVAAPVARPALEIDMLEIVEYRPADDPPDATPPDPNPYNEEYEEEVG